MQIIITAFVVLLCILLGAAIIAFMDQGTVIRE